MREERLEVVSDGLRLGAGIVVPPRPRAVVLLLHGIPSAAPSEPDDAGYPGLARTFAGRGWAAAWVEMRGVRSSQGSFSIEGWVHDALAALEAARAVNGLEGIPAGIVGSSGGGVVAVEAARRGAPVAALALLAAPAAWAPLARDAAEAIRWITVEAGMSIAPDVLADPARWVAEFEAIVTEDAVGELDLPILIVHGTADDVVPVDHAPRIAKRARRAELRILEGSEHHLRKDPEAIGITLDWLDGVL